MTMKYFLQKFVLRYIIFHFYLQTFSSAQTKASDESFIIENYYKVKWGYADEFINLWKTNHYPLLKKAIEKGDIISVDC